MPSAARLKNVIQAAGGVVFAAEKLKEDLEAAQKTLADTRTELEEAKKRADAAERAMASKLATTAPSTACSTAVLSTAKEVTGDHTAMESTEITQNREEAKRLQNEAEALWKVIAESVEPAVLDSLRKQDEEARVSAKAEFERQRRLGVWEALRESVDAATFAAVASNSDVHPALPVSVARRLFEAADAVKTSESMPRLSTGKGSLGLSGAGAAEGTSRVSIGMRQAPLAASCIAGQKRSSFGCTGTGYAPTPGRTRRDSAPETQANVTTPARTFPGGLIVETPQSASVRDRVRALESGSRKD